MPNPILPPSYTDAIATAICEQIATTHKSIKAICKSLKITVSAVMEWAEQYPEFAARYTRAKAMRADMLAAEILEIADDTTNDMITRDKGDYGNSVAIQRARLMVDARKWAASKIAPARYGVRAEPQPANNAAAGSAASEHRIIFEDYGADASDQPAV